MFYFHGARNPDFKNLENLDYDNYWDYQCPKLRDKLREREYIFIDLIEEGSKVLDIACGMSPFLIKLKEKKKCDVIAFDVSGKAVEEQKKNGVRAEVRDIGSPDFELSGDFDYIVLSEIIEHLVYPEKLINKIKHKAKYLIISLPNSAFYRYRLGLLFKGRFFTQWAYHPSEHLRFWSHIDFVDWLEAMDLEIVRSVASNGLNIGPIKLFNLWKNLFGHQIVYVCKAKS
ncbi:methyltransferase domain-containing protein [Candidatus Parcubacteria bacterium]|nr:methyltransferase domain-containing protein [Candidatus Parcubacteria bacterium]